MPFDLTENSSPASEKDVDQKFSALNKQDMRAEVRRLAEHAASIQRSFFSIERRLKQTQTSKDISPALIDQIGKLVETWSDIKKVAPISYYSFLAIDFSTEVLSDSLDLS